MAYKSLVAVAVIFVFVAGIAPAWAQSQAAVRGQVLAAADRTPISGVKVTLDSVPPGESIEATTDSAGWFAFQNLRPGEYVLSTAPEGFSPRQARIVLNPREVSTVTLPLDLRRVEVNVEVTGEIAPIASTYSPSSTRLSAERFDTMPATQRLNLPEAIVTAAPGMIRGHDDFVHIRGQELALNPLINGVSFWENPHAVFSGGVSPDVIETANVMTGAFSAEYGNRFGGVVDIVTKSGFSMQNDGSITLNGGQAGRRNFSAEFGGNRGRAAYYLFGSAFSSDRFLSPPAPQAIHNEGRGGHAFVQLDGNLGRAGSLRVNLMGDGVNFQIPKTPRDQEVRPGANAAQRTRQQTAIVGWTLPYSSSLLVAASFYQRWSHSRLLPAAGPLTARASVDREVVTTGGKADVTRFAGRHAIKAGADLVWLRPQEQLAYGYNGYRELAHVLGLPHIHIDHNAITFFGRRTGSQVSGYVQDGIQVASRLTVDIGVRVDRHDLVVTETHASPRVNVGYQVGRGAVLHASYNHFFVPPPIEGVLSSSAGLTRAIREIGAPLPALEPTIENQFEVGATLPLRPVQLGVTGYYRASDNPVHTAIWPDSRIYSYASFDGERAFGLEAKAELRSLTRYGVTGYLNYALGRVYFYNPVTGGFVTEAAHITETRRFLAPMDQTHTLTTGLAYRHAGTGLWVGTAMEYGSGTPVGHGGADHTHGAGEADHAHAGPTGGALRVPGHFAANLAVGLDLLPDGRGRRRFSLRLDAENITNNVYKVAQENEFAAGQFSIPRLISATARVRF